MKVATRNNFPKKFQTPNEVVTIRTTALAVSRLKTHGQFDGSISTETRHASVVRLLKPPSICYNVHYNNNNHHHIYLKSNI